MNMIETTIVKQIEEFISDNDITIDRFGEPLFPKVLISQFARRAAAAVGKEVDVVLASSGTQVILKWLT